MALPLVAGGAAVPVKKNITRLRWRRFIRLHAGHSQAVLVLSLCLLVWMAPLLFDSKALFWGTPALQFIPWWHQAIQMLGAGSLPLWNPLLGMGAPLLANFQSALLYPPTWLLLAADFLGGPALAAYLLAPWLVLHLVFSGAGMARLGGWLGLAAFPRLVAAITWALCGYLTARINFPSILVTAAWLPWLLWALTPPLRQAEPGVSAFPEDQNLLPEGNKRLPHSRSFLLLVFILCLLLLAGHAQTAWYSLLFAGVWTAYFSWQAAGDPLLLFSSASSGHAPTHWIHLPAMSARPRHKPIRRVRLCAVLAGWLRLAAALLLACALAAPQLLPTAEYLLQSQRAAAVDYDLALTYSYWPWRLVTLLAPGFFGSPAQGDFWGYANYWENALYLGLLPLLLAFSALVRALKGRTVEPAGEDTLSQPVPGGSNRSMGTPSRRLIAGAFSPPAWYERSSLGGLLFILILVCFVWGFGRYTPVFPWLFRHVPTFDLFQAPARVLILAQFCLALLAGCGAQTWRRPQKRALYWTRLATAGALAVSGGAGLAWLLAGDISPSFIRASALAGGWGVLAGLLSLSAPVTTPVATAPGRKNLGFLTSWQWAVVGVTCLDLLLAAWGLNPGVPLEFYQPGQASEIAPVTTGRVYLSAGDEEKLKFENFFRFDTYAATEPWENLRRFLLPNLGLLQGAASLNNFDPLLPGRYARWMETLDQMPQQHLDAWLEWMGVSVLEKIDPAAPGGVVFVPRQGGERFYFVTCAISAPDEESAWQAVTTANFDPQRQVVLENPQQNLATSCDESDKAPSVQLVLPEHPNAGRYSLQLTNSRAGWLVVADTWYPGWQARLDGRQVPLLRANYLFRAVAVEPGVHAIEFAYHPVSFSLGLWISLAGWLVCLALMFAKWSLDAAHKA